MKNGGNIMKTITKSRQEWIETLHKLANSGEEFYLFYADIEDALDQHPDDQELTITFDTEWAE